MAKCDGFRLAQSHFVPRRTGVSHLRVCGEGPGGVGRRASRSWRRRTRRSSSGTTTRRSRRRSGSWRPTPSGPGRPRRCTSRGGCRAEGERGGEHDGGERAPAGGAIAVPAALAAKPAQPLEAYLRAGIANSSYFLEDYATAAREWAAAYPHVNDADAKAWVLYRAGLSEQRLGRFAAGGPAFRGGAASFSPAASRPAAPRRTRVRRRSTCRSAPSATTPTPTTPPACSRPRVTRR